MDLVTGAEVTVALTVPGNREHLWDLVTAIERIGEWSPETNAANWCDPGTGPVEGARFQGHNRFPSGLESTVTCVVTEAQPPSTFAWHVLDAAGDIGSTWRYELRPTAEPGGTVVRHTFTHGPGRTGLRADAEQDPRSVDDRLVRLCRIMTTTIVAMATDLSQGARR
ncbi:SRPBCC family protein [Cryptosporangium arvum]|uniref:SRPBCC family protein n=1 Tax=Cryptosporangium arvum TaxID=80871 RepID=UPI0004BBD50D|nr:SRPBCC family protein [Cryptosporangium arvum]